MSLIVGDFLKPERFFSAGNPIPRGSSFDLTVGTIFDHEGKRVEIPLKLKPGEMAQVVSAEVFCLPDTITGHVTYKTALTRKGIWALTVGVVDPGWSGPIATTLLNFSSVDYSICTGSPFLRVSFFEHEAVSPRHVPSQVDVSAYLTDVQRIAMTRFKQTFLNQDDIAKAAGERVLQRIRSEALVWVTAISLIFATVTLASNVANRWWPVEAALPPKQLDQVEQLKRDMQSMADRMNTVERPVPLVLPPPVQGSR